MIDGLQIHGWVVDEVIVYTRGNAQRQRRIVAVVRRKYRARQGRR